MVCPAGNVGKLAASIVKSIVPKSPVSSILHSLAIRCILTPASGASVVVQELTSPFSWPNNKYSLLASRALGFPSCKIESD